MTSDECDNRKLREYHSLGNSDTQVVQIFQIEIQRILGNVLRRLYLMGKQWL